VCHVPEVTAGAGVHGGDQGEAGGEGKGGDGPGQGHEAVLQRLAERLEGVPAELGQLVEKEDAVVGEAHFPGTRDAPAADEAGVGDGVVGGPEGPDMPYPWAGVRRALHAGIPALGVPKHVVTQHVSHRRRSARTEHDFADHWLAASLAAAMPA
jgi:hypothetical protein